MGIPAQMSQGQSILSVFEEREGGREGRRMRHGPARGVKGQSQSSCLVEAEEWRCVRTVDVEPKQLDLWCSGGMQTRASFGHWKANEGHPSLIEGG